MKNLVGGSKQGGRTGGGTFYVCWWVGVCGGLRLCRMICALVGR